MAAATEGGFTIDGYPTRIVAATDINVSSKGPRLTLPGSMPDLPAIVPSGPWYRTVSRVSAFYRASLAAMGVGKAPPGRPGASYSVVARKGNAESDLSQLARSPAVFAAVNRRAETFANSPIRVYEGYGMGDVKSEPLDPDKFPWVANLLRLIESPDPADLGGLFPASPGELLISQLVADLLLSGVAFVIPTRSASGDAVIGLTRVHPAQMTLVDGGAAWEHRPTNGYPVRYPRTSVSCLRLVSWQASGAGDLGTGAGEVLRYIVQAEVTAMKQTADIIAQGGADVVVTGKTPQGMALMTNDANRDRIAKGVADALAARDGQRVIALGGDIEVKATGLTPADIQAPEFQAAAKVAELMALGCVPVAAGSEASTYASAVLQYRVQSAIDEGLATVFEGFLFRPLAQQFARRAGYAGWMRVTARFDLSQHPGAAFIRSESIDRITKLVDLGYSTEQAASIEGQSFPKAAGPPRAKAPPAAGADAAQGAAPAKAVGEGRTLSELFPGPIVRESSDGDARQAAWRAREASREPHDAALQTSAKIHLVSEQAGYVARALSILQAAATAGDRRDTYGGTTYGPIDMGGILGELLAARDRWVYGLSMPWADCWDAAAADAFVGAVVGEGVDVNAIPRVQFLAGDYDPLYTSAGFMADYDQREVSRLVTEGVNQGMSPSAIAAALQESEAFSDMRASRIARTESVRSQESATLRRYRRAAASGMDIKREWMSDPVSMLWIRRHDLMDGQVVGVDDVFTYPSGKTSIGPGMCEDPGESVNCRCGSRAVVAKRAT